MINEIIAALDEADGNDEVRAIVFTGNGRIFCAGADLSAGDKTLDYESQGSDPEDTPIRSGGSIDYTHPRVRDGAGRLTLRLYRGAAVGVGVTMTLAMDVRLASTDARFGLVFTCRGIVPEGASTWFLQRIVGLERALDWCLTGRLFHAEEALEARLVRSLHAPEDLLPAAYAYAREITENTSPISVALTKQMLWRMAGADHPMAAHRIDSRGVYSRGRSADAREGVASLLEKRQLAFPDLVSRDMPDFYPWWEEPEYSGRPQG
jgi:enoyl-CoA hydratase/carnithine racemase